MKQETRNRYNFAVKLLNHLSADKKKTVMAVCLITLMIFMWVRVLTNKSPAKAGAAGIPGLVNPGELGGKEEVKITYKELSKVTGRHDVLRRDFFASNGWSDFRIDGKNRNKDLEEVSIVSKNGSEEKLKQVAERKLKLEAIVMGGNPRAFINDKLLGFGEKLRVRDEGQIYEFEIASINENEIVLKCEDAEIALRLTQMIDKGK
ncbi:MAG: hypothetical protein ACYTBP_13355 [Planctomycetota bacterium]|jgi:hypothetical protein